MLRTQSHCQSKAAPDASRGLLQAGLVQRKCAGGQHPKSGGECEGSGEKSLSLWRSAQSSHLANGTFGGVPPIVREVLESSGQPLDVGTRSLFESRLGHDFSNVRVHTDARASESARAVRALAYTVGKDVVFGAGRYAPTTTSGQHLLAHELAHVVEQATNGGVRNRLQRFPVFSDGTCDTEKMKVEIIIDIDIAARLVKKAVDVLADPQTVAGPLKRFFQIDLDQPDQLSDLVPIVKENLSQIQQKLDGRLETHCVPGSESDHARAWASFDPETMVPLSDYGITFNRNIFNFLNMTSRTQIINTVIHETAHLVGIGHGESPGERISNKHSLKVRGFNTEQALNSAEVYMRFVRAVT